MNSELATFSCQQGMFYLLNKRTMQNKTAFQQHSRQIKYFLKWIDVAEKPAKLSWFQGISATELVSVNVIERSNTDIFDYQYFPLRNLIVLGNAPLKSYYLDMTYLRKDLIYLRERLWWGKQRRMLLLLLNPDVFLIHLQNTRYCGNAHNDAITSNSIIMMPTDTPTRAPLWGLNPREGKLHVPSVQLDIKSVHD